MPLPILLDENVRGPLWQAIRRHNVVQPSWSLDALRVGDIAELPLGIDDPAILSWCEQHQRLLVTQDLETMPLHVRHHLLQGSSIPGVILVRTGFSLAVVVEQIVVMCHASTEAEMKDQMFYLPL